MCIPEWQSHILSFSPFGKRYIPNMDTNAWLWYIPLLFMQCTTAVFMVWPPLDIHIWHWQASVKDTLKQHCSRSSSHRNLSKGAWIVSRVFHCLCVFLWPRRGYFELFFFSIFAKCLYRIQCHMDLLTLQWCGGNNLGRKISIAPI